MAVGQAALGGWSSAAVRAAETSLEWAGLDGARAHVRQLRAVLVLHVQHRLQGHELSTVPDVALHLRCSEVRAGGLLTDALGLAELPEALESIEWGLLTVEQSSVVVKALAPLSPAQRLAVWQRLLVRLRADVDAGHVESPARLKDTLAKWVIEIDPEQAVERRKQASEGRKVDYRKRVDSLGDVFLLGLTGPDCQAVLLLIQQESAPVGPHDERTADQRRLDAAVDLILGRSRLRFDEGSGAGPCGAGAAHTAPATGGAPAAGARAAGASAAGARAAGASAATCSCLPGAPAPCGARLQVLVPLGAALGTTDQVAELVGHGPLEPDLLQALLLNNPTLTAVFVDEHGVPVGLGRQTLQPPAGDVAGVREALGRLAGEQPDRLYPQHPDDHPPAPPPDNGADPPPPPPTPPPPAPAPAPAQRPAPEAPPSTPDGSAGSAPASSSAASSTAPSFSAAPSTAAVSAVPTAAGRPHPPGTPGPYRVTGRLRRLVFTRAPRCEWPACGIRAVFCDAEHDRAHPCGPTCTCNLGPLCRRHHRVKQLGWVKVRGLRSAVRWISPTGRYWTARSQHTPPRPPVRPLPLIPGSTPSPWDEASPLQLEQELRWLADCPDDPAGLELRSTDVTDDAINAGPDQDRLGDRLTTGDTRWTLSLADPYAWIDPEAFSHH